MAKKDQQITDTDEAKPAKTRTPRSSDSITAGALKLPLADRCDLRDKLIESIKTEVAEKAEDARLAKEIAGV